MLGEDHFGASPFARLGQSSSDDLGRSSARTLRQHRCATVVFLHTGLAVERVDMDVDVVSVVDFGVVFDLTEVFKLRPPPAFSDNSGLARLLHLGHLGGLGLARSLEPVVGVRINWSPGQLRGLDVGRQLVFVQINGFLFSFF